MPMLPIPWKPDARQLRQFGLCGLVAVPLLGWFLLGRTAPTGWTGSQWGFFGCFLAAGAALGGLALACPRALGPVFVAASLITLPLGLVVSEAALLVLYFVVLTPLALLFRLFGRDPLQRRFEPQAATYWAPRRQPDDPGRYFRQS
jgi:hypothetical protein